VTNGLLAHDLSLPWDHIPGNALRGDYVFKVSYYHNLRLCFCGSRDACYEWVVCVGEFAYMSREVKFKSNFYFKI